MTIVFDIGKRQNQAHDLRRCAGTFDDLRAEVFATAGHVGKDGPWVSGPFSDGHRCDTSAMPRRFVALDLDKIGDQFDMAAILEAAETWRGFAYTTSSHDPEAGAFRMRLLFETSRDVTPAEYPRLCSGVAKALSKLAEVPVVRDTKCDKIEQLLFTVRAGATTWTFEGAPIVVDELIDATAATSSAEKPSGTRDDWLAELLSGADVHQSACRLVGRMVAKGLEDALIRAWFAGIAHRVAAERGVDRAQALLGKELDRMIADARKKGFGPEQPEHAGIEILRADQVRLEPIRWLWDGYLARGKMHIIAGAPGTGKTTVALALAATLTTAGRWPDGTTAGTGNVLIWSGEDDPGDTLVPRLRAMDADLSRIAFIDGATEIVDGELRKVAFDPAKHLPALALRVAQEPPALVIIDPIVSAVAGDSHKNSETRRGLQPLVDLARLHDFALFGVTHFSKGTQGRDPTERVTGSLAFGALARMVFVATKTKEGRVFMKSKSNIATDEGGFGYDIEQTQVPNYPDIFASRVLWGAAIEGNAREVLAEAEAEEQTDGGNESTETDEAIDALRDVLSEGEMVAKEVKATMRAAGYTDKVIRLARERLGVQTRREGFGKEMRSLWSLPPDPESAHSCPEDPFVPCPPNSETRARMDTEGTNGADADQF